jgi:hypothetical protein
MHISKGRQLTYCTNVHPGEDWNTTFESIKKFVPIIKKSVCPNDLFGLGLRLSNQASQELGEADRLAVFKTWLNTNGIYIFTMNGFPFGNFHETTVKDKVHQPDWSTPKRLDYTKRLFEQLSELLPKGMSGGISTSPVSYKHWYRSKEQKELIFKKGAKNMVLIADMLYALEQTTGQYLHLDIEPEPDGMLENTEELIYFFDNFLISYGRELFQEKYGLNEKECETIVKKYITMCYDICHFSLAYEEPKNTFEKLAAKGIQIGKIQISAALKALFKHSNNDKVWDAVAKFDEPTYLHQVTVKKPEGVVTYPDLTVVLKERNSVDELRAHFHVPIFLEKFDQLYSTQDHIVKVLDILKTQKVSEHLEIETYTWDVLPKALKQPLSDSIIREIQWVQERL